MAETKFAQLCILASSGRGEQEEAGRQFWQTTPSTKLGATVTWRQCVSYRPPLWWNSGRADCSEVLATKSQLHLDHCAELLSKQRATKDWSMWGRPNTNRSSCFTTIIHSRWNCSIKKCPNFNTTRSYESNLTVTKELNRVSRKRCSGSVIESCITIFMLSYAIMHIHTYNCSIVVLQYTLYGHPWVFP